MPNHDRIKRDFERLNRYPAFKIGFAVWSIALVLLLVWMFIDSPGDFFELLLVIAVFVAIGLSIRLVKNTLSRGPTPEDEDSTTKR